MLSMQGVDSLKKSGPSGWTVKAFIALKLAIEKWWLIDDGR
jgi:hypothetical protein